MILFYILSFNLDVSCNKIDHLRSQESLIKENKGKKLDIEENDLAQTLWKYVYETIVYGEYVGLSAKQVLKQVFKTYFETVIDDNTAVKSAKLILYP